MSRRDRARALREIRRAGLVEQVEAAKRLAADGAAFPELRELLDQETAEDTRYAIVYALSWQDDLRGWPLMIRLLSDGSESPLVRSQAAEGLAYLFPRKRRGARGFEAGLEALLAALGDPAPVVRYYAAFALGESGDSRVLPALRRMRKDRATSGEFVGSVADEARDAVDRIRRRLGGPR